MTIMPNNTKHLRIASRESALALWQSNHIKQQLELVHPGLSVEIVGMTTKGDKILDVSLSKIGGKGLFVKELETSLLAHETDIAVHSMKDVPMEFPEGLELAVICERETPFDAFVSNHYNSLGELPSGATVGTSSLRRQSQLSALRPDIEIKALRGNVNTRLAKLDRGEFDAIILAAAGLKRLGFDERIKIQINEKHSLPAAGQGAIGIECRSSDEAIKKLLAPLAHQTTELCVGAERAMNHRLNGGCQVPIAGYASLDKQQLTLTGLVASIDGKVILKSTKSTSIEQALPLKHITKLGTQVAEDLLAQGAQSLLDDVYND